MDDSSPFEGLYEKARQIYGGRMLDKLPTSLISLGALKKANPQLAKQIFVESYVAPLRDILGEETSSKLQALMEELESRFLQEDIVSIRHDLETVLVAELVSAAWTYWCQRSEGPLLNEQGYMTQSGLFIRDSIAGGVGIQAAAYFVSCERLTGLLFAAALAGREAVEAEIERHREVYRPAMAEAIARYINDSSDLKEGVPAFNQLTKTLDGATDDQLMDVWKLLQGTWFSSHTNIKKLIEEVMGVTPEIEF